MQSIESGDELRPAAGLELLGSFEGAGTRASTYLVRRHDGQVVHLSRLLYLILLSIGVLRRADADQVAREASRHIGRTVDADGVRHVVDTRLAPAGLASRRPAASATQPDAIDHPAPPEGDALRAAPLLALRLRRGLVPEPVHRRLTQALTILFRPLIVAAVLAAFVAVELWLVVSLRHDMTAAFLSLARSPGLLLGVAALTVASAAFHELGHAAAARYGGARPGALGVGVYLIWPVFYTDVTDAYRLGRRGRLRTDLGGVYFNLVFLIATAAAYALRPSAPLLVFLIVGQTETLRQFLPFIRLDGYHIVSDLAGVPNLFAYLRPVVVDVLRVGDERERRAARARLAQLTPRARRLITVWVCATAPILALNLVIVVLIAPRFIGTAWADLSADLAVARRAATGGDTVGLISTLLEVALLAAPALGFIYLAILAGSRALQGIRRWFRRRPYPTAIAVVVGVGLLAAELTLVWPNAIRTSFDQAREPGQWVAEPSPQPALVSVPAPDVVGQPAEVVQPIPTVPPPPPPPPAAAQP